MKKNLALCKAEMGPGNEFRHPYQKSADTFKFIINQVSYISQQKKVNTISHARQTEGLTIINGSCFDKEPFELYFSKAFYTENSNKINEIKDDVYSSFKKNLTFGNSRYKIKLPFKEYNEALPDKFNLSKIRSNNLKTRLDKNKNLMVEYDKIIKQYINDGIVEPIRSTKTSYDLGSVHYLPHRPVVYQSRDTTKLRTVFDASAHVSNEPSLNDVLYSGPCMLPLLHDISIRFRIGKIGVVADV